MTLSIVSSFPSAPHQLSPEHVLLAEKKIAGVGLDALECTRHAELLQSEPGYKTFYDSKSARIHWINDVYTRVFDTTAKGVVSVVDDGDHHQLHILGCELVVAIGDTFQSIIFSRLVGVDYVVVSDGSSEDQYRVDQKMIPSEVLNHDLSWSVNTRLCLQEYFPAVEEVYGWVGVEVAPSKTVEKYVCIFLSKIIYHPLSEAMIAALPVDDSDLPRLKKQINKMLSYPTPELTLLHERSLAVNMLYQTVFNAKLSRIHGFEDPSVKLLDYTKSGIAKTSYFAINKTEYIILDGKVVDYPRIYQSNPVSSYTPFCRDFPGYTDKVIICDVPNLKNWVKIERWKLPQQPTEVSEPVVHYVHLLPDTPWHTPQTQPPAIPTITERPIRAKSASGKKAQAL